MAAHIGVPSDNHSTREALARAVVMELENYAEPWLLIYDNVEDPKSLNGWIPEGQAILVTSRYGRWPSRFAVQHVGRLALDDAANLLLQESGRDAGLDEASGLAKALGCLPLALVIAGGWLQDTPEVSFSAYNERIDELILARPDEAGIVDYDLSIFTTVKLSLDRLGRDASLLLRVFAFLSPDDLWPSLVCDLADRTPDNMTEGMREILLPIPVELWELAKDEVRVERAFAELVQRSLLEKNLERDGSFGAHRITLAGSIRNSVYEALPMRFWRIIC